MNNTLQLFHIKIPSTLPYPNGIYIYTYEYIYIHIEKVFVCFFYMRISNQAIAEKSVHSLTETTNTTNKISNIR